LIKSLSATSAIKPADSNESYLNVMHSCITCPACRSPLATIEVSANLVRCNHCKSEYPLFDCGEVKIPWLFQHPEDTQFEWKARLNGFLHTNQIEQQRLKSALKDKRLSKLGQKRVKKLLNAKQEVVIEVNNLLKPLALNDTEDHLSNPLNVLHSKTPKNQGLDSYYNNIFRDWCWQNAENKQLLEVIDKILVEKSALGKILTIGAGAGRLSYDIHRKYTPEFSVLMDINPLLLFSACHAIQGNSFKLTEFPIAPLNKDCFAVQQTCLAPKAVENNILYLLADGMNPPIKSNSMNTIITPWLLDIIPQNLRDYIPRLNNCLEMGGTWINTGSLAFFHKQPSWCYSEEELFELIEKSGFKILSSERETIQYLKSPHSAHGRTETVLSFQAKKVKEVVVPPAYEYLPEWIKNISLNIPKQYEQELISSKHLLQAQVLAVIDGEKSIEQIGKLIAKQYKLEQREAIHAVRQIMIEYFEE